MMLIYDWDSASLETTDADMVSFVSKIYRDNRYLEAVPDTNLRARLDGLVANLVTLDLYGMPSFLVENGRDAIAFVDLLEELRLRDLGSHELVDTSLGRFADNRLFTDIDMFRRRLANLAGHKCLFKFTKKEYVDAILCGEIRFRTASSYYDEGFNIAIRDDELNIEHVLRNLRITTKDGAIIPPKDNGITVSAADDYYVSCFSASCEPKLFTLFECDACVVIIGTDKFVKAIIDKYESMYPEFYVSFGPVDYIDPFRQLDSKRPIEFQKIYNFSYEKEYRFVSFTDPSEENLDPIQTLSIGVAGFDYEVINL